MATRRPALKLFLDSSVLFTAVNSPSGGSAKLLSFTKLHFFVSEVVLHEVEKNVRNKLTKFHVERFFNLASKVRVLETSVSALELEQAKQVIIAKDALILATFHKSSCNFLLTLDKRDFMKQAVFDFVQPKRILTPKDFFAIT